MAVPKCRECEYHRHNNGTKTTINISATRTIANKTNYSAHFCTNKESFRSEYSSKRWIPTVEMGSSSPEWCSKRDRGGR